MLAVWYERNGEAAEVLQFGELETPAPATGEVRVRLAASGVNPIDVKRRRGARGQVITDPLVVPGFDGAGARTAENGGSSAPSATIAADDGRLRAIRGGHRGR